MARKAAYTNVAETEETAEVVVRQSPDEIEASPRARPEMRNLNAEKAAPAILPIYLREMGSAPLIRVTQEVELAQELQDGREGLAKTALTLAAAAKQHCLEGDLDGPMRGRGWSLDDLETFYAKLVRYHREHRDESRLDTLARQARTYKRHVDHARDALILANLRLVVHIAKKYLSHGISFMDLIQEGNIGLMRAVEKFEHERGNKFSTYGYWWIKQAVERAIADKGRVIRIPVHVNEKIKKISRVSNELAETLDRKPTPAEIARKLSMPLSKIEEVLGFVPDTQALENVSDDDNPGLLRFIADPNAPCPLGRTLDRDLREKIENALKVLTSREAEIIRLRFGIGGNVPCTLEEIGRGMGLSRERVRQLEAAALKKVQETQESGDLRDFLG